MRAVEPELFKIDVTYSKYGKLLTAKAFKFLMSEAGFDDPDEINKKIENYYKGLGINHNESP
jgi:hypothetical protein